jgi:hypothetical protein
VGLEGVEFVLEVEKSFRVEVARDDTSEWQTPRDVVNYFLNRVPKRADNRCVTQETFFRLRRGFRKRPAVSAKEVKPDTRLKDLINKEEWPSVWRALRQLVGTPEWPDTISWPGSFRGGPDTLRELTMHVAMESARPSRSQTPVWTRDQVALEVRKAIHRTTGKLAFRMSDDLTEILFH